MHTEKATFGAGCFWGIEDTFRKLSGVVETTVGYAGGTTESPTYEDVCSGTTGHAEVVRVEFNPDEISYDELLRVFWEAHDPTQVGRQGVDIGDQYRSVVFFHTPEQEAEARASRDALERRGVYDRPITTQIVPFDSFYKAEEYHQDYFAKQREEV